MQKFNPPPCVCNASDRWELVRENSTARILVTHCKCGLCDRPGQFVEHDGGNVFVIPCRYVEKMPSEVLDYMAVILELFHQNALRLDALRLDYERLRYRRICETLRMDPDSKWETVMENTQFVHDILCASIYTESGWWRPERFNPTPTPPVSEDALVYVLAVLKRGNASALCWQHISYERPK